MKTDSHFVPQYYHDSERDETEQYLVTSFVDLSNTEDYVYWTKVSQSLNKI